MRTSRSWTRRCSAMSSMPPEMGRMQGFVAALLAREGALVEAIEPEGLEVLATPQVQQALELPELCRLGFGPTLPSGARRMGIENEWLDRFDRLLGDRGRWRRLVLRPEVRPPSDPERVLGNALVLDNATFRLLGVTPAWTRYSGSRFPLRGGLGREARGHAAAGHQSGDRRDAGRRVRADRALARHGGGGFDAAGRSPAACVGAPPRARSAGRSPAVPARREAGALPQGPAAATEPRPGAAARLPRRPPPGGDAPPLRAAGGRSGAPARGAARRGDRARIPAPRSTIWPASMRCGSRSLGCRRWSW